MLTFNQLSEKKSQVKINPKQADLKEKIKHGEDCECQKCDDRRDKEEPTVEGTAYGIYKGDGKRKLPGDKKKKVDEGKKKKDDTYLETDWEKRKENNEKARKDLQKGPQMKNPHLESIEVVVELNRYGKDPGKATGSLNKRPGSPVAQGGSGKTAVNVVRNKIRKTETGKPEGQRKTRKKGEKTADMKGPSAKLQKNISNLQKKRALNKKAKDARYKSTQDYVNVKARYPDK
jgi:hypothetical protein